MGTVSWTCWEACDCPRTGDRRDDAASDGDTAASGPTTPEGRGTDRDRGVLACVGEAAGKAWLSKPTPLYTRSYQE